MTSWRTQARMESPAYSSESGVGMEDAEPSARSKAIIQREPEYLEFTERVDVGAVA